MITRRKIYTLWFIWLLIWPLLLWLSYEYSSINIEGQWIDIFLFAVFMCIVALFPLTINNNPIFFINGISMAVFLSFGLIVETILTQLTILTLLLNLKIGKKELYRFPLNMLMFAIVSFISANVFWLLGGDHQAKNYHSLNGLIPILGYVITVFVTNQLILKLLQRYLHKQKVKIFDKGLFWEAASSLLVLPVGFVLFVLFTEIGREAIFYLGIPFISISIIFKLLYSYQEINRYLKRTGEIGHQLTKRLEVNEVYNVFISELDRILPMDFAYIYVVVDNQYLELVRFVDTKNNSMLNSDYIERNEAFSGKVWATRKPIMYSSSTEWGPINNPKIPVGTESILSLPVEYGDSITGVVTLVSKKRKAFDKSHFRILDILTNYLGVAIENAKNYEDTKAKSERDSLTQLYNYRYFESALNNHFNKLTDMDDGEKSSLLLLDLDHFKAINDRYGHEAGNEILCQVANRLIVQFGDFGLIARYGGEEFVVFLPGIDLPQASKLAESLRKNIEGISFPVEKHILNHCEKVEVSVTASIGIATYPLDCESPSELIRHADRAMYIGAKRKGRNRVAVYGEFQTS
ncbi:sensor domain-containing diguanylate cyclase [Virgibacillus ndiopensis]|uniref:sensor domain-containing diguanylate cyclase n=1 Tax=Virgibacillus ndiopensis TaxID=2004408 RepID=UPI00159BA2D4|nr:sensor domain-containing diguanylate cyclase [Virgibacillus ndiopensis]